MGPALSSAGVQLNFEAQVVLGLHFSHPEPMSTYLPFPPIFSRRPAICIWSREPLTRGQETVQGQNEAWRTVSGTSCCGKWPPPLLRSSPGSSQLRAGAYASERLTTPHARGRVSFRAWGAAGARAALEERTWALLTSAHVPSGRRSLDVGGLALGLLGPEVKTRTKFRSSDVSDVSSPQGGTV